MPWESIPTMLDAVEWRGNGFLRYLTGENYVGSRSYGT
jgi:hypothetical protein